jgi:hypothetical protein
MADNRPIRRTFLSVQHRAAITEELSKGISAKHLARQYGVSREDIVRIRRENERSEKRRNNSSKRKARRRSSVQEMEDRLYAWIQDQQAIGFQLTDPLIQAKAIELSSEQEDTSVIENKEWLAEFKRRYKIGTGRIRREETCTRKGIEEEIITDVSNETIDNENEVDGCRIDQCRIDECRIVKCRIVDADSVEPLKEEGNIEEDEQEVEIYINDEEEEDEHEATEVSKTQLSLTGKENNDINIFREILRKYACNNEAVLIMGEALVTIMEKNMRKTKEKAFLQQT